MAGPSDLCTLLRDFQIDDAFMMEHKPARPYAWYCRTLLEHRCLLDDHVAHVDWCLALFAHCRASPMSRNSDIECQLTHFRAGIPDNTKGGHLIISGRESELPQLTLGRTPAKHQTPPVPHAH